MTLAERLIALADRPIYSGPELAELRLALRSCAEEARRLRAALEDVLAEQSRQALEAYNREHP
jgi:hypothetical protein